MTHSNLMKVLALAMLAIMAILALTGCADVSNVQHCLSPEEYTYGFFSGVWHGIIIIPSFIGSLFNDNIAIYAVNNTGWTYNFGFVLGIGVYNNWVRS
jgi:hypothetical protein